MRKYLFRAKRNDNGEWVEAKSVADCTYEDGDVRWYAGAGQPGEFTLDEYGNILKAATKGECLFYEVDPETIDQSTGRIDRKGNKVFERDILQIFCVLENGTVEKVKIAVVLFDEHDQAYVLCNSIDVHDRYDDFGNYGRPEYYEVIGNIHDNPELMKIDHDPT